MRKNYQQVRKQKELAKKVRQQEKQQRRTARLNAAAPAPAVGAAESDPVTASDAIVRGAS
jgi:hypothetical protein